MSRYQALRRHLRCDPLTAGAIAFLNWARGVPAGVIVFMTLRIEYDAAKGQP